MSKPAANSAECLPSHPGAPKKATSHVGRVNSYVSGPGGKGKGKKSRKRHVKK